MPPPQATLYRILVFGQQARLIDARELAVRTRSPVTAAALLDAVAEQYPPLRASMAGTRLAVDGEFWQPDQPVEPASEVALIGMIGGG